LLISPLVIVPVFTWYALPFQTAHHVFLRVSYGQAMKLTRSGKKLVAEGSFARPAPTSGGSRGSYTATIKVCNPSC
jgi:hypothetical protein